MLVPANSSGTVSTMPTITSTRAIHVPFAGRMPTKAEPITTSTGYT